MPQALLIGTILVPGLLAAALARPAWRPRVLGLVPLAAAPALAAGLLLPADAGAGSSALLLGLRLGLDETSRVFLLFSAFIWTAVGLYLRMGALDPGDRRDLRFLFCFLVAMAGNLGLIVALDGPAFYLFFSILTFAAYGVIVSDETPDSRLAGRLYLALALCGEMLMLAGFVLAAGGRFGPALAVLLYLGMGVKHGILPLHVWLPVAHGTAPTPASALLSGAMLKAGFIGWIRFFPEASPDLTSLSGPVIWAGLGAAYYGAAMGILQAKAKMLLGYSSISQMGIVTAGFGVALADPGLWPAMVPALGLYALHHALVKAGLFLGLGVSRAGKAGSLVYPGLAVLALALTGLPLTGGALAKLWLDEAAALLAPPALGYLDTVLALTATASTLLMARFLVLARHAPPPGDRALTAGRVSPLPFLILLAAGLAGPWIHLFFYHSDPLGLALSAANAWKTLWPVLLGAVLLGVAWLIGLGSRALPGVPPGDIAVAVLRLSGKLRLPRPRVSGPRRRGAHRARVWLALAPLETLLRHQHTAGIGYLLLVLALVLLAGWG